MKKNFALLMVMALVIGFTACDKKPVKKIGEPVTIDDNTPIKELWRGVVTGNVKTFGPWGIIEVANPTDDREHRFEMCVIIKEAAGPANVIIPERIKVGTEIYFSKNWVYTSNLTNPNPHGCDVGLFYSVVDHTLLSEDMKIINPPKK